jgi:hypothetical protein
MNSPQNGRLCAAYIFIEPYSAIIQQLKRRARTCMFVQLQNPSIAKRLTVTQTETDSEAYLFKYESVLSVTNLVYGDTGQFVCNYSSSSSPPSDSAATKSASIYVYVHGIRSHFKNFLFAKLFNC